VEDKQFNGWATYAQNLTDVPFASGIFVRSEYPYFPEALQDPASLGKARRPVGTISTDVPTYEGNAKTVQEQ